MKIRPGSMNLLFIPENQSEVYELGMLAGRINASVVNKREPPTELEAVMFDYRDIANHLLGKLDYVKFED